MNKQPASKAGEKSFFARVYQMVGRIPSGRVASYGQIAILAGAPRAARMVGWALHAIPADRDLPWHRVVGEDGRIRLDQGSGQRALLAAEGVEFDHEGRIDMCRFRWQPEG